MKSINLNVKSPEITFKDVVVVGKTEMKCRHDVQISAMKN